MKYRKIFIPLVIALVILGVSSMRSKAAAEPCSAIQDDVVNVKSFGATGNGSTDDTDAIKAAAACAANVPLGTQGSGGATLYFPTGTYVVSSNISIQPDNSYKAYGIVIRGDDSGKSTISSNSSSGVFSITLPDAGENGNEGLDVHDIGFVADIPDAGAAINLAGTATNNYGTTHVPGTGPVPRLHFFVQNVSFAGANSSDYFDYGFNSTGTDLPVVNQVTMTGGGGTACFAFGFSYGIRVSNSSCDGAETGVLLPNAAEGDWVTDSKFTNVNTGISIEVTPYYVPGPSGDTGKIEGNTIEARSVGVDLQNKNYFFINNNTFQSAGSGTTTYTGLALADDNTVLVHDNTFSGSDANETGIALNHNPKNVDKANIATIASNTFGTLGTDITIGSGVSRTTILGNTFSGTKTITDNGTGTYFAQDSN